MEPIVIIGTGLAGYGVARELRKLDKETPLLLITADDGCSYSKPMLSTALTKKKTPAQLATADVEAMGKQLNAQIRSNTQVSSLNPQEHTIEINGEVIVYSKLVLALGADTFQPPMEGCTEEVISVNDLNDYERFRQALEGKKRVAILGGGLIGCEFANDLGLTGYEVDVIDRSALPLGHLLPQPVAERLLGKLLSLGMKWHGRCTAQEVSKQGSSYCLQLDNGEQIESDLVLSAIGLRARLDLAQQAGLQTDRGIVVDSHLQTSVQDVYALGDCAQVNGQWLPFVMPLMRSAKALAQTLAGTPAVVEYPAMPVIVKTSVYPMSLLPPPPGIDGEWVYEEEPDIFRAKFFDVDKKLRGFVLCDKATTEANKLALQV